MSFFNNYKVVSINGRVAVFTQSYSNSIVQSGASVCWSEVLGQLFPDQPLLVMIKEDLWERLKLYSAAMSPMSSVLWHVKHC